MPEEQQEKRGIVAAVDSTDWARYAGQGSDVRRRGERRRRRFQAGAGLGTTAAVAGMVFAVNGLGPGPVTRQGAAPAARTSTTPATPTAGAPGTPTAPSSPVSAYPVYPATIPTKPLLVADAGKILRSGVIGAGTVSGHQWQFSYRVIPSGSAANSKPQVNSVDVALDGKVVSLGYGEGATVTGQGYAVVDQYLRNGHVANPIAVGFGSLSPSAVSVDLKWANGTVVQLPVTTVDGTRFTTFGWDPANPPQALEQVNASGVQQIKITHDSTGMWAADSTKKETVTPATTPVPTTPGGTPNLSQTPHVTPISSGIFGAGTVSGHSWQIAYEVIPSGSAANSSNEVLCTDTTVDGTTRQGGCTSGEPFGPRSIGFALIGGADPLPIVVSFGGTDAGTTAVGLEWADGTKTATVTHDIVGEPMAALAFDPANPPAYYLEFGSYGEYRIPLRDMTTATWTFNW